MSERPLLPITWFTCTPSAALSIDNILRFFLGVRKNYFRKKTVYLSVSTHSQKVMLVDGDPLLLVGQGIYSLGFIVTSIYLMYMANEVQSLHFFEQNSHEEKMIRVASLILFVGGLFVATGTYATIGLILILIILFGGLWVNLKRRLNASWETSIDSEFHIHKITTTIGLSLILLEGPRWGLLSPDVNIITGVNPTCRITNLSTLFTIIGVILINLIRIVNCKTRTNHQTSK